MLVKNPLEINEKEEVERIVKWIKHVLQADMHKRGLVVAISGGVDSAVCAALCVEAIGPDKVFGLLLPEQDSSSDSVVLGKMVSEKLGIEYILQNIAPTLEAIGCYAWRDKAMKAIFPDYEQDWKSKIVIAGGNQGKINYFQLVVQKPDNQVIKTRLGLKEYLQIVAATNYKQRIRKSVEYFHADRLNYAVVGTPNRLEYDQGFFVKNGDGSADIKPIAHLYKTQVYSLARYLELPEEICTALPTTDTYSMTQGQDEFYFALPYKQMDMALWAYNHNIPEYELAKLLGIEENEAEYVYKDIMTKRKTTAHLHSMPYVIEKILDH